MYSADTVSKELNLEEGVFVIFGITGDLVKRKLLTALYQLTYLDLLPKNFKIIGTTRRNTQTGDVITAIRQNLDESGEKIDEPTLDRLAGIISMVHMDISSNQDYRLLKDEIELNDKAVGKQINRLYYLAVPPDLFGKIVQNLKDHDLNVCSQNPKAESRLLIEKPFGRDRQTAVELIESMSRCFNEKSIYRVDHYLAKETAQNILTFRFNNPLFTSVWDNRTISHIIITASEVLGIEGRVSFYEQTGALRDLIQSHLLQLLALTTMEEPVDRSAASIHKAKLELLESIEPIAKKDVSQNTARGQYETYRHEVGEAASTTETYAALKLNIRNKRWKGVPVLLRTGKSMREKITEITLVFKDVGQNSSDINSLTIRIQPNEGIVLNLLVKKPSLYDEKEMVQMKFFYNQSFETKQPDAYERVLIDAIRGDKTLFTTHKEVLASWAIIDNVLKAWQEGSVPLELYPNGAWGPKYAEKLAQNSGISWQTEYKSS